MTKKMIKFLNMLEVEKNGEKCSATIIPNVESKILD